MNKQYMHARMILGALVTSLGLGWSLPAVAEIQHASGDPRFLHFLAVEDGTPSGWHPQHHLTDEERQSLRRDLDRARRDFYRDPDSGRQASHSEDPRRLEGSGNPEPPPGSTRDEDNRGRF